MQFYFLYVILERNTKGVLHCQNYIQVHIFSDLHKIQTFFQDIFWWEVVLIWCVAIIGQEKYDGGGGGDVFHD